MRREFEQLTSVPEANREELRRLIRQALSEAVKGEFSQHKDYPVYITKKRYRQTTMVEGIPILIPHLPEVILSYAKIYDNNITQEDLLILDVETTGLSRGAGLLAFMIGIGYYEDNSYYVEQYFMPEPESEINAFDLLLPHLERKNVLVTFNGKSFDLPILESRFLHNHLWVDLRSKNHLDLLHLARRLWKRKVPTCALETLEYYILGHIRDKELDIEGSIIPQTYFQFLTTGDPELLKRIFLHNQTDVLHTAALLALICEQTDFPLPSERDIRIDYHALGKLYYSQNKMEEAITIFSNLIEEGFLTPELAYDLGVLYKKRKRFDEALNCFQIGADLNHDKSLLELSILLEQKQKNYSAALQSTELLLDKFLLSSQYDSKLLTQLEKRRARLQQKILKTKS